jgi:hypothetical protein
VRLASLSPTRRTPDYLCPDRNIGERTWYAGDLESRGDAGGPSPTYPTADVIGEVGCPGLYCPRPGVSSGVAVLRVA